MNRFPEHGQRCDEAQQSFRHGYLLGAERRQHHSVLSGAASVLGVEGQPDDEGDSDSGSGPSAAEGSGQNLIEQHQDGVLHALPLTGVHRYDRHLGIDI